MAIDVSTTRCSLFRRYKRLISALDALLINRFITRKRYKEMRTRADDLYAKWKSERRRLCSKKPGRPRRPIPPDDRRLYTSCKCGCGRPPAPGQAYATRECAPFADYGVERVA